MAAAAAATESKQFQLNEPPRDGISAVKFSPKSDMLLVSSWDTSVKMYDVTLNSLKHHSQSKGPVFDCAFIDDVTVASGGLDKAVVIHDFATASTKALGFHDDAIRSVEYVPAKSMLLTGSWDKTVKVWDPRASSPLVAIAAQTDKVYSMGVDQVNARFVVATADKQISIFDSRNFREAVETHESMLKCQTRCVRVDPEGISYAVSSIDGRVAIEYFNPEAGKKFAFRCHRQTIDGVDHVYPVNALAFHPKYKTFATGGCDGVVTIWDGVARKRVSALPRFPTSVSSMAFNRDGSMLAIAVSYTYEQGEQEHPEDSITIKFITDKDVQPKTS